jgi:hypothetical protein
MRKKTHEEYVAELAIKNPTVEVIGRYNGAKNKIEHRCLIHDVYWNMNPTDALKGSGCELCRREKIHNYHCKTTEQYIEELYKVNPNVIVKEQYIDSHTPILHKCLIHDIEWKVSPTDALRGSGCTNCKSDKIKNKLSKTHEQYVRELKEKNPNIIPIEKYKGANIKILHKCLVDGYEWYAAPSNMLSGYSCPKCSRRFRRTHDDYVREVSKNNPSIEVVGTFVGMQIPVLHKCKIHNIEWMAYPDYILKGCGCSKCGNEKVREKLSKTHEQYAKELKEKNPDIEVVGIYSGSFTPILHKCLIDGYEWYATPANILFGNGCPQCNESFGERQVRQWLEKYNINYIFQYKFKDCRNINPLPFDFYLPNYNICIEYQGEQHYRPVEYFGGEEKFKTQQKHDNIKRKYCHDNNIKLLEIPYWVNIEEKLNKFLFI